MDGWNGTGMNGQIDRPVLGWMDGWMDRWMVRIAVMDGKKCSKMDGCIGLY